AYTYDGFFPYAGDAFAPYPFDDFGQDGSLRLIIEPKEAQVWVDGYYAGVVDDFDGRFQHLKLTRGPHHVEVIADGFDRLQFDVRIESRHKTEYRGRLMPSSSEPR